MRTVNFSTNTLHWRLAHVYGPLATNKGYDGNLCHYFKAVFLGLFKVCAVVLLGGILAGGIADAVIWITMCIYHGTYLQPNLLAQLLTTVVIVIISLIALYGVLFIWSKYDEWVTERQGRSSTPQFMRELWTSIKTKTCVKVQIE